MDSIILKLYRARLLYKFWRELLCQNFSINSLIEYIFIYIYIYRCTKMNEDRNYNKNQLNYDLQY